MMSDEEEDRKFFSELESGLHLIAACPGCGHIPHRNNLLDSLHPSGLEPDSLMLFTCLVNEGGCDQWFSYGRSCKETIDRWNRQAAEPWQPEFVIGKMLRAQLYKSIRRWADKCEAQTKLVNSLKRDFAALQSKVKIPCPTHGDSDHGCKDHYQCWEPCGALGNDERFVRVVTREEVAQTDAALDKLGIVRTKGQDPTFRG